MKSNVFIYLGAFVLLSCNAEKNSLADKESLFSLLSPNETNVHFQNTLTEGPNTNILVYEYFYNGGGVATADFNNDGLEDLYFTSNMGENKLYINQSNFKFKDITISAKCGGRPGPWKTGVSIVDINSDGLPDIYLSYSGALPAEKRTNQLFVNKGIGTNNEPMFEEKASEYGLASTGFSNQAFFLDYDKDNDLDMLLMNHNPKALPILNVAATKAALKEDDSQTGLRLFKNNNQKFEDVTISSGLNGSALSYGLGLGISDLNNDGYLDFYLSNDYAVPDYLYINQKNGTFKNTINESLDHISQFSMGNNIADINNDGYQDIFTLDMLPRTNERLKLFKPQENYSKFNLNVKSGFHYQYMRNMLHLSNGNGQYSEIGQFANISNTDWSWSALFADFSNDGFKDLMVTNGYLKDYNNQDYIKYMNDYVQEKGRLQKTDVRELVSKMPASKIENIGFENSGGSTFENKSVEWGLNRFSNSSGATYADLDNDGDLDYIVNNINQEAFVYRNNSKSPNYIKIKLKGKGNNTFGIGAKIEIIQKENYQESYQIINQGYLSAVSSIQHFGLGQNNKIDTLRVIWPSGKVSLKTNFEANRQVEVEEEKAVYYAQYKTIKYQFLKSLPSNFEVNAGENNFLDFNRQPLLLVEQSHKNPILFKGDLNNDGLEDLIVGGDKGVNTKLFFQKANGDFESAVSLPNSEYIDASIAIIDFNNDGLNDIYLGSGGYHDLKPNDGLLQDRLYVNKGNKRFELTNEILPQIKSASCTLAVADINNDGFEDVFVGSGIVPGRYPEFFDSYLLLNNKGKSFSKISDFSFGICSKAEFVDLNLDGKNELLIVGEWSEIGIYNFVKNELQDVSNTYLKTNKKGWWNTFAIADINNDNKPDVVLGNQGLNNQWEASEKEPASIYFKDYDDNGSVDPIFAYYIEGKNYPALNKDDLMLQFSGFMAKYNTYASYANVTVKELIKNIGDAPKIEINYHNSLCLLSSSSNLFFEIELPDQAQFSPVTNIIVKDFNMDNKKDLLLAGNKSNVKLQFGNWDANHGQLFFGDGAGNFTFVENIGLRGEVLSSVLIKDTIYFSVLGKGIIKYQ